ncbi:aminoglycoside phosphotransferase family protein [Pedococcus sp. 5OH_020]|uniref:aminoglycoside phosphotransferase family protein n=1 Tax=Pedococcus sp. 5OH_020 TaxID=2989814 RepID=UPI0022E9A6F4|nr:aminoglycoside phosphotransferase family protein [Pedococcus sp. 5OH_020]
MTRTEDAAGLVPAAFRSGVRRLTAEQGAVSGPSGAEWSDRLPRLLADLLDDWDLEPVGPGATGWTAVVVPVRRAGEPCALKVAWPHLEGREEALALRHWQGRGAVRLIQADPSRGALLLEWLDPSRDLRSVDVDTACEVVGGLLAELAVPAPPGLRLLSVFAREQADRLTASAGVLPRRMVRRAAGLVEDLTADGSCDATLLHTDLHYENVLAGQRSPWLAIDPHPMAGHRAFELQPLLRNRVEELGSGSAFRYLVRRRLEIAGAAAGLDEQEVLAWSYVHTAIEAGWAAADGDSEGVTLNIALLKALDG